MRPLLGPGITPPPNRSADVKLGTRVVSWLSVALWTVLVSVHLAGSGCRADSQLPQGTGGGGGGTQIRLDIHPLTDPIAVFLRVDGTGDAVAYRYSPARLEVVATLLGKFSRTDVAGLLSRIRMPDFCPPSREREDAGFVHEGDLFDLSVGAGAARKTCSGTVEQAPPAARAVLEDLVARADRFAPSPLAEAYLRSAPIEPIRLNRIRDRGMVRLVSLGDLAEDLRPMVAGAIARPSDFHPVSRAVHDRLLSWCSHGHDLFVVEEGRGHQLSLFVARHQAGSG